MPKQFIEIDVAKVEQLARVCDNEEEIALALGVSYSTLKNRKREFAQFATAIKKGKAKANAFVGGKLMEKIKEGDTASIIFYLKTRCKWSEKQVLDVTTREEVPEGATDLYAKIKAAYGNRD